jgi:hypothetical protein
MCFSWIGEMKYLLSSTLALLSILLASLILPKFEDIIYPFAPNLDLWFQEQFIVFGYSLVCSFTAYIGFNFKVKFLSFPLLFSFVAVGAYFIFINAFIVFQISSIFVFLFTAYISYYLQQRYVLQTHNKSLKQD